MFGRRPLEAEAGDVFFIDNTQPHVALADRGTPLRLLLASLAGCSGNTLALVLGRMQQPVEAIEVDARGRRRDEHPTVLTDITLEFVVRGKGVEPAAVGRALTMAEEQLCPVWAMLKPGVAISAAFTVVED